MVQRWAQASYSLIDTPRASSLRIKTSRSSRVRLRKAVADRGNISITSFNRVVLLTGEMPAKAARIAAERAVARIENVRSTVNELAVAGNSSLASRSSDAVLLSKFKARQVDTADLQASR